MQKSLHVSQRRVRSHRRVPMQRSEMFRQKVITMTAVQRLCHRGMRLQTARPVRKL